MQNSYIAYYRPGPKWLTGKPLKDQPLKSHANYLLALHERGKLIMAGSFTDGSGGLVIFTGDQISEVEDMVADDPAVTGGILVASVKKWSRIV